MFKRKLWQLGVAGLMCFAPGAFSQVTMTLTSGGPYVLDGVYVGPYTATVDGVSTQVVCDDYAAETYLDQTWSAKVTPYSQLGNSSGVGNPIWYSKDGTAGYDEAAWLVTQMSNYSDSVDIGEIQFAIWGIFDPQAITDLTAYNSADGSAASSWITKASAYSNDNFSNFSVLTPADGPPPQEFLVAGQVQTPEPTAASVLGLDLASALGIVFFVWRRRRVRA